MKITKNERKQSRRILKHVHMQRKKDIGDNAKQCKEKDPHNIEWEGSQT